MTIRRHFSSCSQMKLLAEVVGLILGLSLYGGTNIYAQDQPIFKKYAGKYITGHDYGGGSITLKEDGTFSEGSGSDDGTSVSSSGKYRYSDGFIICSVMRRYGTRMGDETKLNLLDPDDLQKWSPAAKPEEIEKEFRLVPIEWSGRIYLLYEDDLKNFANAVNLGIEPRPTLRAISDVYPWFGSFYLRIGDQNKPALGRPSLPKEWLSFLLKRPLTARVIKVESIEKKTYGTVGVVVINKGATDGLKVGMQLLAKKEVPSLWYGSRVISVDRSSARVKANMNDSLKVGDILRTRYEPSPMLKRWRVLQEKELEKNIQ